MTPLTRLVVRSTAVDVVKGSGATMEHILPRFQIIISVFLFSFAIVITSCSSPVVVSEKTPVRTGFQERLRAYEGSDYSTALKKFRPLAEQGDARAQNNLGGCMLKATGFHRTTRRR